MPNERKSLNFENYEYGEAYSEVFISYGGQNIQY